MLCKFIQKLENIFKKNYCFPESSILACELQTRVFKLIDTINKYFDSPKDIGNFNSFQGNLPYFPLNGKVSLSLMMSLMSLIWHHWCHSAITHTACQKYLYITKYKISYLEIDVWFFTLVILEFINSFRAIK